MEKQFVESSLVVRLLIRGKNFEISTEGKASDIYEELDVLTQLADEVYKKLDAAKFAKAVPEKPPPEEVSVTVEGIPTITASRSTIENIQLLFNTTWGKSPRTVSEVCKALEVNAVPDKSNIVSSYLRRLVQRGFLRRIGTERKYSYYKVPTTEHV